MRKPFLETAIVILVVATISGCVDLSMARRQNLDAGEGKYEYVEEHGTSKDSAYDKTIEWIALNYKSANSVIQLQDKSNGKIVVKAVEPFLNVDRTSYCDYTVAITIKDQKMKFNFELGETNSTGGIYPGGYPAKTEIVKIEGDFQAGVIGI